MVNMHNFIFSVLYLQL